MDNKELKIKRDRLLAMELEEKNNKHNHSVRDLSNTIDDGSELFFTKKECDKITNYDQLKKISLDEQTKLHELGANLALKKAKHN